MAVFLRLTLIFLFRVLAFLAFAKLGALQTRLIALAVLLQTVAFLAVTALRMLLH